MVPIHFGVRTIADEINRLFSGGHITAMLTAIAFEFLVIVSRRLRDAKPKIGNDLWLRKKESVTGITEQAQ